MPGLVKRTILIIVGCFFVLLGIAGLVLPFLQGILFLLVGVMLLSLVSPKLRDWVATRTKPYPKVHEFVEKMHKRISDFVGQA